MEIFRWLFKNAINETDIDGIKTNVLKQHNLRLGEPKGPPLRSPNIKGHQTNLLYLPQFGEILKSQKEKITMRNLTSNCLGQQLGQLIKLKTNKGTGFLASIPHWEPKPFTLE